MAKRAKGISVKRQTSDANVLGATVTTSDRSARQFRRTDAFELSKRVQSMVMWCAYFNSTNCASHRMRMYRKGNAAGKVKWLGRKVTDHRKVKYLLNPSRVGVKAASMADDSRGDIEEVTDHPALDLLNNANPWQRGSTFSKACFMQWELYGRRYISLIQPSGEIPTELFVLFTDRVRPIPDQKTLISGYIYGRDTPNEKRFEPDEILWQQFFPSNTDPYGGLSPLHCVFQEADIYSASTISELSLWNKGARPDFAVKVSSLTTDIQLKQMRAEIESRHQGPTKRGDFWFFRDGDVQPLQFTQKEMEYLAGRQDIRSMIGAAYGIPETFWRMNDANLAGSQSAQEFYARWTVAPRLVQDAEEWTESLLPLYGIDPGEYWFGYDDPVPENKAEVRADVKEFVSLGIWSRKYALELVGGRSPEEDGEPDQHERAMELAQATKPAPGEDKPKPGKPKPKKSAVVKELPAPKYVPLSKRAIDGCCEHELQVKDAPSDAYTPIRAQIDALIRLWLDHIAADPDAGEMIDDLDEYESELASSLSVPIGQAFKMGSVEGYASIGQNVAGSFSLDSAAEKFITNYTIRLADDISQTTADDIRDVLKNQIQEGSSAGQRTAAVRAMIEESKDYRPAMIARTETARAQNHGQIDAWRKAGIKRVKWTLAPGACPTCQAFVTAFGDTRDIETPFAKVGDTYTVPGKETPIEIKYASGGSDEGIWAPPAHPSCRCSIDAVLEPVQ